MKEDTLNTFLEKGTDGLFETVVTESVDGFLIVDDNGIVRYANPAAKSMFNENTPHLVGYPIGYPAATESVEILIPHKGHTHYLEMRSTDIRYKNQQMALASLRDITEARKAQEALQNRESQYRSLFNSIRDAILVADTHRRVIDCNPAFLDLFGYSKKDILGKQTLCIYENEEEFRQMGSKAKEHIGNPGFLHMVRYQKKDASIFLGETNVFYLKNDEDEIVGLIGLIRDVTERKQNEKEKEHLQMQLFQAQKMESIGTLAGGIAHDFNNILSAILGYSQLALDAVEKGSELHNDLGDIYEAGLRAKELVRQILTFARQSDHSVHPLQPGLIAKEVVKFIRATIPTTIDIRHRIVSRSMILANPTMVHQILMNLCTNAAHVMNDTGGLLEVAMTDIVLNQESEKARLTGLSPGDYIHITVSDTGSGINADILPKIFDPYFTTKEEGVGTGMGLAMVNGIVEGYKGKITVETRLNQGTTFGVYLPITKKKKSPDADVPEEIAVGSERIMYVDDEIPITRMGVRMLESRGYLVTAVNCPYEALELFQAKPHDFDLIITDMAMPHMSGKQLAHKLLEIRPDLPLVLCTGYAGQINKDNSEKMGFKALIHKPISMEKMAAVVRKVLDETEVGRKTTQGGLHGRTA